MNDNIPGIAVDLYKAFVDSTIGELEAFLVISRSREEKAFYRALINLKYQFEQEKIVGETLL